MHNLELDFAEYLEVRDAKFELKNYMEFSYQSPNDLILHPQWYENWKGEWSEISFGAATRIMFISTKNNGYGCCGPIGRITCSCGEVLGNVFADCYAPQWMLLFESKIGRSDQADGEWRIHADGKNKNEWVESVGEIVDGQKEGEWECWKNESISVLVKTRNKTREEIILQKDETERELIRLETWHQGDLVDSTDIL
ncbi:MAG: hypothetical protein HN390_03860 [Anaerolineae bacterium]|jgi:hypothetical protein|nr:hypothetical protein [Anaerolineae bacterium]MBT7188722.1 hypothetical protein [Anaerolineae bacterium]MBT7990935.1 hypothetical protein [Anaerolineae bacterium]